MLTAYPNSRPEYHNEPFLTFALAIESIDQFPANLELPTQYFSCLLCCDADRISDTELEKFADTLIDAGLVYFCVWGPGCERVHTSLDTARIMHNIRDGTDVFLMTTGHADESLDDALWFMLNCAIPAEPEIYEAWGSRLVISVGVSEWSEHIDQRLSDLKGLDDTVLSEEQ